MTMKPTELPAFNLQFGDATDLGAFINKVLHGFIPYTAGKCKCGRRITRCSCADTIVVPVFSEDKKWLSVCRNVH